MAKASIKGYIVPNSDKWIYDWFGIEATCPADLSKVVDTMADGELLEIDVNSVGGDVQSGMELYSIMQAVNSECTITGFAASAAGVAAMACKTVKMTPVATIMIHNVFCGGISGDYHEMDKASEMLKSLNASMASAYVAKSGMALDKVLKIMDKETWITASKAVEYGFCDEITGDNAAVSFMNSMYDSPITAEMRAQAMAEKKAREDKDLKAELLDDLFKYGI